MLICKRAFRSKPHHLLCHILATVAVCCGGCDQITGEKFTEFRDPATRQRALANGVLRISENRLASDGHTVTKASEKSQELWDRLCESNWEGRGNWLAQSVPTLPDEHYEQRVQLSFFKTGLSPGSMQIGRCIVEFKVKRGSKHHYAMSVFPHPDAQKILIYFGNVVPSGKEPHASSASAELSIDTDGLLHVKGEWFDGHFLVEADTHLIPSNAWISADDNSLLTLISPRGEGEVGVTPDGGYVAAWGGPITVWKTFTGTESWSRQESVVQEVVFFSDNQRMLLATNDTLTIASVATGQELNKFPVDEPRRIQLDPTESQLIYAVDHSKEFNHSSWNLYKLILEDGITEDLGPIANQSKYRFVKDRVQVVEFEAKQNAIDHKSISSGSFTSQLRIRYVDEQSSVRSVAIPGAISHVEFMANSDLAVVAHDFSDHYFVDFQDPNDVHVRKSNFVRPEDQLVHVTLNNNGSMSARLSDGKIVSLRRHVNYSSDARIYVAVSDDGRIVVSSSGNRTLKVWDLKQLHESASKVAD